MDDVLLPELFDRLTAEKKRRKVHNLLQELRRCGRIDNRGTRSHAAWVLLEGLRD